MIPTSRYEEVKQKMYPLDLTLDASLAPAFGMIGLAGQLGWPMLRHRRPILTVQLGIACAYASQYALMGERTGALVCLIGAMQTCITLIAGDRPVLRWTGLLFIPLVLALGLLTWAGPTSALAMTACCLIMLGRMQSDLLAMRAVMFAATPFGILYDLSVGALPALCGALLSAALAAIALRREWLARARPQFTLQT